jgi:hypothetical protein
MLAIKSPQFNSPGAESFKDSLLLGVGVRISAEGGQSFDEQLTCESTSTLYCDAVSLLQSRVDESKPSPIQVPFLDVLNKQGVFLMGDGVTVLSAVSAKQRMKFRLGGKAGPRLDLRSMVES